ncbi:MAG: hypothetical protein RL260_875 [Pseudomonadota bacterium]
MIELIVVLAVIGLLLSLALPHYVQTLERRRWSAARPMCSSRIWP